MFIRKRTTTRGTPSYQIIESYRQGKKVKQRVIFNLGRFANLNDVRQKIQSQLSYWSVVADCKYIKTPEEVSLAKTKVIQLQAQLTAVDKLLLNYRPFIEESELPKEEAPEAILVDPLSNYFGDDS